MKTKIPCRISVGGQEININMVDRINEDKLGECCTAEGRIDIANTFYNSKQSDSIKINTFYHELTHVILDTMGENGLSKNEKFVSCFSSFLCEAMRNAYFDESK